METNCAHHWLLGQPKAGAIEAVCKKHGVKLVQAALRFPLVHPVVSCVIPGAAWANEVALNMETLAATIPAALWADLTAAGLMRTDAPVPA